MSFNVSMCAWLCVCLSVCFVNLCYFVSKCLVFLFCQLPDGADEWNEIFSCCHGVMKSGFAGWVGTVSSVDLSLSALGSINYLLFCIPFVFVTYFLSSFFMFAVLLVNVPVLFVHMTFLTHTNKYCIHTLIYNKIHVCVLLWWVTVSVIISQGLWVKCVTSLTATTAINRRADRPSATTAMKFIQQVFIFSKSLLDNNLCVGLCQRINMFVCMVVYVV